MSNHVKLGRRSVLKTAVAGGLALAAGEFSLLRPVRAQAKRDKVEVVMTAGIAGLVIHEIAKTEGYFDAFGVEPNVLQVSDGVKSVAALMGGSSDICMWSGFNQLTPAIERGAKLKIVAGALSLSSMCLFTRNDSIRTVKDLEGKTVGIGALGAVLHQMLVLLLRKKGVDTTKVTFRNVGSSAEIFKAVVAGTVDAGPSEVDVLDQQEKYKVRALADGKLWDEIKEYTNQASYVTDAAIAKKRDALVRTLAAYGKAYRFVSAPGSLPAYLRARAAITGQSHAIEATTFWNWIQQSRPYATDLVLTEEQIRLVQELNMTLGVQKSLLPMAKVADMSLAKDALKLLG